MASVAQLVARKSHNLKVPGSIPGGGILLLLVNNVAHLISCLSRLRKSQLLWCTAFVAQTVERQPFKLLAVGSIPTEGAFSNRLLLLCQVFCGDVVGAQACRERRFGRVVKAAAC